MVSREDVDALMSDRIRKFSPEDVGYEKAPSGSAFRCASCVHGYSRHSDGFAICEIMRPKGDDPIQSDWRCLYWSADGYVYPLSEESPEVPAASDSERP